MLLLLSVWEKRRAGHLCRISPEPKPQKPREGNLGKILIFCVNYEYNSPEHVIACQCNNRDLGYGECRTYSKMWWGFRGEKNCKQSANKKETVMMIKKHVVLKSCRKFFFKKKEFAAFIMSDIYKCTKKMFLERGRLIFLGWWHFQDPSAFRPTHRNCYCQMPRFLPDTLCL